MKLQSAAMLRPSSRTPSSHLLTRALATTPNPSSNAARQPRKLTRTNSINSGTTLESNSAVSSALRNFEVNTSGASSASSKNGEAGTARVLSQTLVGSNVHMSYDAQRERATWAKRPLIAREGEGKGFASGTEAAEILIAETLRRDPYQLDYSSACKDWLESVAPVFERHPQAAWLAKKLMEPERLTTFRVSWVDDQNNQRINRGYRVQYSSALGPYRGGLVLNQKMSHGWARMLGFEQTLRQALSGDGWGGASGGADLDVRGKSPNEIRRFCFAWMQAWLPLRGNDPLDYIEGGSGVGPAQLDALLAGYRKAVKDDFALEEGLFPYAGACSDEALWPNIRRARGAAYFANRALEIFENGQGVRGKLCALSGSSERAQSFASTLLELGARPLSFSDGTGYLIDPRGFESPEVNRIIAHLRHSGKSGKGRLDDFRTDSPTCKFVAKKDARSVFHAVADSGAAVDLAVAADTNDDLSSDDADALVSSGCRSVFEVADRACKENAVRLFEERDVLFAPSKVTTAAPDPVTRRKHAATAPMGLEQAMRELCNDVVGAARAHGVVDKRALRVGSSILAFTRLIERDLPAVDSK